MATYIKPQSPIKTLKDGVDYRIYPLTTWDQVIVKDNLRMNAIAVTIRTEDVDIENATIETW